MGPTSGLCRTPPCAPRSEPRGCSPWSGALTPRHRNSDSCPDGAVSRLRHCNAWPHTLMHVRAPETPQQRNPRDTATPTLQCMATHANARACPHARMHACTPCRQACRLADRQAGMQAGSRQACNKASALARRHAGEQTRNRTPHFAQHCPTSPL